MVAVPAETPVTAPEEEPTVAIPVEPEDHVPPEVASVKDIVDPTQTLVLPEIAEGVGFTLTETVVELVQPILVDPVTV